MRKLVIAALSATILGAGAATAVEIRDGDIILFEKFDGSVMQFEPIKWPDDAHGIMLTVETLESKSRGSKIEEDFVAKIDFGKEIPALDLAELGKLVDGTYVYEITGGTSVKIKKDEKVNNGRSDEPDYNIAGFALSGHFVVEGSKIVVFEQGEEKGSEKPIEGEPVADNDEGGKSKSENLGRDTGGKEEPGADQDKG